MRNTFIFLIVLAGIAATVVINIRDMSRTAVVEGQFAPEIRRVNYKWAYLRDSASRSILDSCLVLENRFTLTDEVRKAVVPYLITFSGLDIESGVHLRPQQTVRLTISPDTGPDPWEEAILEAIARLDSAGLTITESEPGNKGESAE